MSTSGSFNPPDVPACAYEPRMTRAQALAHRAAGTLDPNCVVVITDGPVIGTAGNTSPTEIELNPVSATDLGMSARVHTTFDPSSAWEALYDIDTGAAGTITRMTDGWNNTAQDSDPDAPTVHTQVPWHKSSATFRDNFFDHATLPGWSAAGGVIRDNVIQESTVNLTGKTAGTFNQNQITGSLFVSNVPTAFITGNQLTTATVQHLGTGAGSFSFAFNVMLTGNVSVDAATTSQVTINNNVIGGSAGGFRVAVNGKTNELAIISGNRLFNQSLATADLIVSGTGEFGLTNSEISGSSLTFNTPGIVDVIGANLGGSTINVTAGELVGLRFQMVGSTANHQGNGLLTLQDTTLNASNVITATGSTRGLRLLGATAFGSIITQNGTGATNNDSFQAGVTLAQAVVNLNATAAGTPASSFQGVIVTSGGQLNVADHTDATPVQSSRIDSRAILNLSGAGVFITGRISSDAVLNLTANATSSVIEGAFTKSPIGVNTNRLCNKGFDDWVA